MNVDELLKQVGLAPEDGEKFPHEFSGGQRQRMSIAGALSSKNARCPRSTATAATKSLTNAIRSCKLAALDKREFHIESDSPTGARALVYSRSCKAASALSVR